MKFQDLVLLYNFTGAKEKEKNERKGGKEKV
jgi:hypothetical protein